VGVLAIPVQREHAIDKVFDAAAPLCNRGEVTQTSRL
jgi:hypothetical protein